MERQTEKRCVGNPYKRKLIYAMASMIAFISVSALAEVISGPIGSASSFRSTAVAIDARMRGTVSISKAESGLEMRVRTDSTSNTSRLISTPLGLIIRIK